MGTECRKRDMRKPFRIRLPKLAGGCPAQSRKTWGQWGLWGALSKMREMIVQNRTVVRFVMLAAWAKLRCTWLSKIGRLSGLLCWPHGQNFAAHGCPKCSFIHKPHKPHRPHKAIVPRRCPECCLKTITACAQRLSNSSECQGG